MSVEIYVGVCVGVCESVCVCVSFLNYLRNKTIYLFIYNSRDFVVALRSIFKTVVVSSK